MAEVPAVVVPAALEKLGVTPGALDVAAPAGIPKAPPAPSNKAPVTAELPEIVPLPDAAAVAKAAADKVIADAAIAANDKDVKEKQETKDWQDQYVKIDDPHATAAIELLQEAHVSPIEANAIFAKAIEAGDLNLVDWATLTAKVGAAKATLIKTGVETYFNGKLAVQIATTTKTHEIMGGEANWNLVRAWAQATEKVDAGVKAIVADARKMLDQGGWAAENAAHKLKSMYEQAAGNSGLGTSKIVTGTGATSLAAGAPVSREDYMKEMHILNNRSAKPAEVAALNARRKAGIAKGI